MKQRCKFTSLFRHRSRNRALASEPWFARKKMFRINFPICEQIKTNMQLFLEGFDYLAERRVLAGAVECIESNPLNVFGLMLVPIERRMLKGNAHRPCLQIHNIINNFTKVYQTLSDSICLYLLLLESSSLKNQSISNCIKGIKMHLQNRLFANQSDHQLSELFTGIALNLR